MTKSENTAGNESALLLGVSRGARRDRPSFLEFFRGLFGMGPAPVKHPKLPKPSGTLLASRTTAELQGDHDETNIRRRQRNA